MGWNGSGGGSTPVKPKVTAKKPSPVRGLVAGAVLVAAVIGCYFAFFSGSEKPQKVVEQKKPTAIKEVKPAAAPKAKPAPKKDVIVYEGKEYPLYNSIGGKAYVTGYGVRYATPVVITSKVEKTDYPWCERPFKRYTDRTIASLLYTEPGTFFVGGVTYDERFTKQFLKSLNEPIVIEPDDDEDVKELKQAVIETRKELKARHDNGEDVAEIIQKTHDDLRELGAYKHELEKQLSELSRRKDMTEQDLDDYVTAANMMLEQRGCSKLTMPEFVRRGVRLREQHYKKLGIGQRDLAPNKVNKK